MQTGDVTHGFYGARDDLPTDAKGAPVMKIKPVKIEDGRDFSSEMAQALFQLNYTGGALNEFLDDVSRDYLVMVRSIVPMAYEHMLREMLREIGHDRRNNVTARFIRQFASKRSLSIERKRG